MSKSNFLLVDLNELQTKKLAETITSDTSRKILNYLADKPHDTEANIAKILEIPISTVHYHLQKLQEAQLVTVEEFHYSPRGREVNHYKLANKYIIIAPQKVNGLKEKLQGILPVGMVSLGIAFVIKILQEGWFFTKSAAVESMDYAAEEAVQSAAAEMKQDISLRVSDEVITQAAPQLSQPDLALWFLAGSVITILLYLITSMVREYLQDKKKSE